MSTLGHYQKRYLHMIKGLSNLRSPFLTFWDDFQRMQEARLPCPTDGRRKGRRRYGYKRFPSGDRRAK